VYLATEEVCLREYGPRWRHTYRDSMPSGKEISGLGKALSMLKA